MPDIEIASAFKEVFSKKIVRITAHTLSAEPEMWFGTGCIIGYVLNPRYKPKAMVATAGHLLKGPHENPIEWTVERSDSLTEPPKKVTFRISPQNPEGPKAFYYKADPRLDIGGMFVDAYCVDGRSFLELDRSGKPCEPLVPLIDSHKGVAEGTRVAWAGFPATVQKHLGFPQICYYEGVVAAMINTREYPPLYLLDGHNTSGISGAPVWAYNDDSSRVEFIAIIVGYLSDAQEKFPGFACATPINPLLKYLNTLTKPSFPDTS